MEVVVNCLKNNKIMYKHEPFVDIATALLLLLTFSPSVRFLLILTFLILWYSRFIYFKDVLNNTGYEMLIVVLKNAKLMWFKI